MQSYLLNQPFSFDTLSSISNKHSLKMIMVMIIQRSLTKSLMESENDLLNVTRMFVC